MFVLVTIYVYMSKMMVIMDFLFIWVMLEVWIILSMLK